MWSEKVLSAQRSDVLSKSKLQFGVFDEFINDLSVNAALIECAKTLPKRTFSKRLKAQLCSNGKPANG